MKRETFRKEHIVGLDVTQRPNKTIVLPFNKDTYAEFVEDKPTYKAHVKAWMNAHPELFPEMIEEGWSLYGFTTDSVKQDIRIRRIVTKADGHVWQIRPAFVMPYMTCETNTAEKILFLQTWAPAWAFAHVFEKDVMTIHRLTNHMGRYTIVGTTVKQPDKLPKDVGADEKHGTISGEKVSMATTVADQCFFGASVSVGAGEDELTEAYGQFQREAQQVQPDYQPETVNTDGWHATMKSWRTFWAVNLSDSVLLACHPGHQKRGDKGDESPPRHHCRARLGGLSRDDETKLFPTMTTTPGVGRDAGSQSVDNQTAEARSKKSRRPPSVRFSDVFENEQHD